nr:MAG TPA: hypothetical protein [Caudoviricetes sp.]
MKLAAISTNTTTYFLGKSLVAIVALFLSGKHVPIKFAGLVKDI